jgi:orotate phosphoribosyltransferase-like protein
MVSWPAGGAIQQMAKERTSVRMQTQIKIMSEQGHSIRTIARVLKLSRRTVRKYLEPEPVAAEKTGGWEEQIDWEYVGQEVGAKGTTIKQIGREVAPRSSTSNSGGPIGSMPGRWPRPAK